MGWLETVAGTDTSGNVTTELHEIDAETGSDSLLYTATGTTDPASRPQIVSTACDVRGAAFTVAYPDHSEVVALDFAGGARVVASRPSGASPSGTTQVLGVAGAEVTYGVSDLGIVNDLTRVSGDQSMTWSSPDKTKTRLAAAMMSGATVSMEVLGGPVIYLKPDGGDERQLLTMPSETPSTASGVTTLTSLPDRVLVGRSGTDGGGLFSVTADGSITRVWAPPLSQLQVSNIVSGPGRVAWSDDRDATAAVRTRDVGGDGTLGAEYTVATGLGLDPWSESLDQRGSRVGVDGRRIGWVQDEQAFVVDDGATRRSFPDYRPVLTAMSGHRIIEGAAGSVGATVTDVATGVSKQQNYALTMWGQTGIYSPMGRGINLTDTGTGAIMTQSFVPLLPSGTTVSGVVIGSDIYAWRWTEQVDGHLVAHVRWANPRTRAVGDLPVRADAEAVDVRVYGATVGVVYRAATGDSAVLFDTDSGAVTKELTRAVRVALGASGVVWVDGFTGVAYASPMPGAARPPAYEGNPIVKPSFSALDGTPWTGEWAFSQPLTQCDVDVIARTGVVVRTLPCDGAAMSQGEAMVSWDGRDTSGRYATTGSYSWAVRASGAGGAAVEPYWPVAKLSGSVSVTDDRFTPVTPTRLVDTRSGLGAPTGPVAGGNEIVVKLAGDGPLAAAALDSVALNVTAVTPSSSGYLTVYPSGATRPTTSHPQLHAGGLCVEPDAGESGCRRVHPPVHVGEEPPSRRRGGVLPDGQQLRGRRPLPAARHEEDRTRARGEVGRRHRHGALRVPTTGVGGAVLNVTAVNPSSAGYLTAWPAGVARPTASNVNFAAGRTVAGLSIGKVGLNGKVSIFASAATDLVVDLLGWVPAQSDLVSLTPARVLDTRSGLGAPAGPLGSGGTVDVRVLGRGGVPAQGVKAVVVNVTSTGSTSGGYVTAWPTAAPRPTVSMINYAHGQTIANSAVVTVGATGSISLYLSGGGHAIVDVMGYITE